MPNSQIFSKFGLIGENLDLKKNVSLEIDKEGKILNIDFENPGKILDIAPENKNYLMIPGLINSHIHIADNFAKEMGFNKDLHEIVAPPFGLKHKILRQTPEDIKIKGIQNAALEMLSNGITYFIDFREGGIDGVNLLKNALKQSPINYLILGRFEDESEIESIFNLAEGVGLASYHQITETNKKWVIDSKRKFKKIIACHCAENNRNINLIRNMVNDDLVDVIVHGTKFIKEDLEKIKKKKKSLILCPRCNGYFGSGFPPITEILRLGIRISLGTDNLMVNNADLFEELRYFYRISRVLCSYDENIQLTSKDLLKMVTINAAKNFKFENKFGSISEGKSADLFMIDLNDINFFSYNLDNDNIFNIITQRTKSENIKKTYIKGELVFERS
ncbi:MAG: amidohydrolase family protein [Candidatus Thorarchaeota archaeon]